MIFRNVNPQSLFLGGLVSAKAAGEHFLSGVYLYMHVQASFTNEMFITELTLVRFFSCMSTDMRFKVVFPLSLILAKGTM